MKTFIIASASAIALLGLAACSDATDDTTTRAVPPTEAPAPADPAAPPPAMAPAPAEPAPAQ